MVARWVKKELIKLLGTYTISGNDYNFNCPFCRRGHLHINFKKDEKGVGLCHKCGFATRNLYYLIKVLGGDFELKDAGLRLNLRGLKKRLKQVITAQNIYNENNEEKIELPAEFELLTIPPEDAYAKFMLAYLIDWRGLMPADVIKLKIGFCKTGRFAGMLIFPVFMNNELVYYTSRRVLRKGQKSLHPSSTRKDYILYGIDQLASDHLFICEGVFDTLAFDGAGVAVFGNSLSIHQAHLLDSMNVKEITVALDSDVPQKRITQTCKLLASNTSSAVSFISFEEGDPFDHRHDIEFWISRRIVYNPTVHLRQQFKEVLNTKKEIKNANSRIKSSKLSDVSELRDRFSSVIQRRNRNRRK